MKRSAEVSMRFIVYKVDRARANQSNVIRLSLDAERSRTLNLYHKVDTDEGS